MLLFYSTASFAPISFAIKAKENDLLPLEKNRVKLDDDSDEEEEEGKEGQENANTVSSNNPTLATPCPAVEEKKPQLTPEELEAKQGILNLLETCCLKYSESLREQNCYKKKEISVWLVLYLNYTFLLNVLNHSFLQFSANSLT